MNRQQWIVSAYSLTFGCFQLLWGRIADVCGRRSIFLIGTSVISIIAVAIPFSPNEIVFNVLRGIQGLGAAANYPTAIGILSATFPPGKAKNYALTCFAAGTSLGSITGILLSGFIGQSLTWKWIFWILSISAVVITIAATVLVPAFQNTNIVQDLQTHVDWVGYTLITCGLIALMFALTEENVVGWSTPWIPGLMVVSGLLITFFVYWQKYLTRKGLRKPLIKLSVFRSPPVNAALVIIAFSF